MPEWNDLSSYGSMRGKTQRMVVHDASNAWWGGLMCVVGITETDCYTPITSYKLDFHLIWKEGDVRCSFPRYKWNQPPLTQVRCICWIPFSAIKICWTRISLLIIQQSVLCTKQIVGHCYWCHGYYMESKAGMGNNDVWIVIWNVIYRYVVNICR